MPNFEPTRATALVRDGKVVSVIHVGSTHMDFDATNTVPCLIRPAPVPIAECPPEWKDGRNVWLYKADSQCWGKAYWDIVHSWWESNDDGGLDDRDVTHVILPPPDPTAPPTAAGKAVEGMWKAAHDVLEDYDSSEEGRIGKRSAWALRAALAAYEEALRG